MYDIQMKSALIYGIYLCEKLVFFHSLSLIILGI